MGRKAMKPEISVSELVGDSGWTSTKMLRKETLIRKRWLLLLEPKTLLRNQTHKIRPNISTSDELAKLYHNGSLFIFFHNFVAFDFFL